MSLSHVKSLDGIRAIAMLMVIFFHYISSPLHYHAFGGMGIYICRATDWMWSGVDLFFVLSGFLIGRILITSRSEKDFLKTFYLRRVYRIFPPYYLALFIFRILPEAINWDKLEPLRNNVNPLYSYLFFIQNFSMARLGFGNELLSVAWSLAVEEQFYLIFPFIILLIKPNQLPLYCLGGILLAPGIRAIFGGILGETAAYVLLPSRMDGLLMGVLISYLYLEGHLHRLSPPHIRQFWQVTVFVFASLMAMVAFTKINALGGVYNHSHYTLLYGLVIVIALLDKGWVSQFLSYKVFGLLAKISYTSYLVHDPINSLLHKVILNRDIRIFHVDDLMVTGLSFCTTLLFSALSYHFIEKPILSLAPKMKTPVKQVTS
jgi:peptidoglycan/LPS O-acetylase OafA/YrhL